MTPEPIEALVERVREGLWAVRMKSRDESRNASALAALTELAERVKAAEERLTAYETPGWINSVQKVMEERRRAEVAEAQRDEWELTARAESDGLMRMREQRDELVEALQQIEARCEGCRYDARAALAKLNEPTGPVGDDTC